MIDVDIKTKEFIRKAKEIHGDLYDYSKTKYTKSSEKVQIECKIHGIFEQEPGSHVNKKHGCKKCALALTASKKTLTLEQFIEKSKEIHGDKYNYSSVKYTKNNVNVEIICPLHGSFNQKPNNHIANKQGCPDCGVQKNILPFESFLQKAKKIHGDCYDYTKSNYISTKIKIEIICSIHGSFSQKPNSHMQGEGCPTCGIEKRNLSLSYTIEYFIQKSKEVHGDRYDYSESVYKNSREKTKILCKIHGTFLQTPDTHLAGSGCKKCGLVQGKINVTKTTEQFITEANMIHNYLYDYSKSIYLHGHKNIDIICSTHGLFDQSPHAHLQGQGCHKCGKEKASLSLTFSQDYFLQKSKEMHSDKYDYSLVKYINSNTNVEIICPLHGSFNQKPHNHVGQKQGCPKCGILRTGVLLAKTTEQFIKEANIVHNSFYDYSKSVYDNSKKKLEIICPTHGSFYQIPNSHLNGQGCLKCNNKGYSKKSIQYLEYISNLENVKIQHALNDGEYKIKTIGKVDGYCKETNTVYEYHGNYWHGNPRLFSHNQLNKVTGKTFGELYNKTIERDNKIRSLGYNLVVMWEDEWKEISKN